MQLVALVVLLALSASMASAYDYSVLGQMPSWWDLTNGGVVRAEWQTWREWIDDYGAVPDSFETNLPAIQGPQPPGRPEDERWRWSTNALVRANVSEDGILVDGHNNEWDFDLVIGNQTATVPKYWYLEFETDLVTDNVDLLADRFTYDAIGRYVSGGGADSDFTPIAQGWELVGPAGSPQHLLWWGEFYLAVQPDLDKFNWQFNTNDLTPGIDDFHVTRVTTGTYCPTPELSTWALLACSGLALFIPRRRRKA